jgi:hypothetical protein
MSDAARSCIKCGGRCRFLLCDRCYEATPHCDEPIAVSHQPRPVELAGMNAVVDGVWRA